MLYQAFGTSQKNMAPQTTYSSHTKSANKYNDNTESSISARRFSVSYVSRSASIMKLPPPPPVEPALLGMISTPLALVNSSIHFRATRRVATTRVYSSINCNTPYNICFVRHGQSTWNRDNRFIGWTDTPLTEDGVLEARVAGRMLQSSGILFDEAHTVSDKIRSVLCDFASFMYSSNATLC